VTIYVDATQTKPVYRIAADRVFDISARYCIEDQFGPLLGVLFRRGMQSLWRAHYEVHRNDQPFLVVREENPWVKVLYGILDSIPLVGMVTGYRLHPAQMTRVDTSAPTLRVSKQPAFVKGRYHIDRSGELHEEAERRAVLSLLMMLLLERQRR
jgi:hypothetical protein